MSRDNILFFRNRPDVFNLGDFLCTPLHYLDFSCNAYETTHFLRDKHFKVILGGGAFNDLGLRQNFKYADTVLWGAGSSIHGRDSKPTQGDDLPFALYGVRDPDAVSDPGKVLPCVSCLHPLVQLPAGNETNIFLNADEHVTDLEGLTQDDFLHEHKLKVFTNQLSEMQFMKAFARTKRVITNSYHASYWSLLSGREVAIVGYSSKFRSLMRLVGLNPESLGYYESLEGHPTTAGTALEDSHKALGSNPTTLKGVIRDILKNQSFHRLSDYSRVRAEFIEKNIQFAEKCREIGFIKGFKMRTHRPLTMMTRNIRYTLLQKSVSVKRRTRGATG